MIGPLRAALHDPPFRLVDKVLELAVIQVRYGQRHYQPSSLAVDSTERCDEGVSWVGIT